jgi:hypothetical protein
MGCAMGLRFGKNFGDNNSGHIKTGGFLAHISCGIALHFIQNLTCVIFTVRCSFSNIMPSEDQKNWIYNNLKYLFPLFDTILDGPTEFPVRSLNFLRVIPADPWGK